MCSLIFVLGALLVIETQSRTLTDTSISTSTSFMLARFEQWIASYGRVYKDMEKQKNFQILQQNIEKVES